MSERINIPTLARAAQVFLWACLFLLVIIPSSTVYGQDPEDDVEEYFGEDDEYEDDEYEDDEYLDDEEYDDEEYDDEEYDDEYDDEEYDDEEYDDEEPIGSTADVQSIKTLFVNRGEPSARSIV